MQMDEVRRGASNFRNGGLPLYGIEAVLEFDLYVGEAHAAGRVQERPGVGLPYSIQNLADYDDFIELVCGIIASEGFVIFEDYQSSESYSYYIKFKTKDAVVQVKFRISDHVKDGVGDAISTFGEGIRLFKSFILGEEAYRDQVSLQRAVRAACKAVRDGNYELFQMIHPG